MEQIKLTDRQYEVVWQLFNYPEKGLNEIAENLFISYYTIKSHIDSICHKCDIYGHNRRKRLEQLIKDYGMEVFDIG